MLHQIVALFIVIVIAIIAWFSGLFSRVRRRLRHITGGAAIDLNETLTLINLIVFGLFPSIHDIDPATMFAIDYNDTKGDINYKSLTKADLKKIYNGLEVTPPQATITTGNDIAELLIRCAVCTKKDKDSKLFTVENANAFNDEMLTILDATEAQVYEVKPLSPIGDTIEAAIVRGGYAYLAILQYVNPTLAPAFGKYMTKPKPKKMIKWCKQMIVNNVADPAMNDGDRTYADYMYDHMTATLKRPLVDVIGALDWIFAVTQTLRDATVAAAVPDMYTRHAQILLKSASKTSGDLHKTYAALFLNDLKTAKLDKTILDDIEPIITDIGNAVNADPGNAEVFISALLWFDMIGNYVAKKTKDSIKLRPYVGDHVLAISKISSSIPAEDIFKDKIALWHDMFTHSPLPIPCDTKMTPFDKYMLAFDPTPFAEIITSILKATKLIENASIAKLWHGKSDGVLKEIVPGSTVDGLQTLHSEIVKMYELLQEDTPEFFPTTDIKDPIALNSLTPPLTIGEILSTYLGVLDHIVYVANCIETNNKRSEAYDKYFADTTKYGTGHRAAKALELKNAVLATLKNVKSRTENGLNLIIASMATTIVTRYKDFDVDLTTLPKDLKARLAAIETKSRARKVDLLKTKTALAATTAQLTMTGEELKEQTKTTETLAEDLLRAQAEKYKEEVAALKVENTDSRQIIDTVMSAPPPSIASTYLSRVDPVTERDILITMNHSLKQQTGNEKYSTHDTSTARQNIIEFLTAEGYPPVDPQRWNEAYVAWAEGRGKNKQLVGLAELQNITLAAL